MEQSSMTRFEPLSIGKLLIHTSQGKRILEPSPIDQDGIRFQAKVLSLPDCECLILDGTFTEPENPAGFPDSFLLEGAIQIPLLLEESRPYLAIYQHKSWWTSPFFADTLSAVPVKTQMLLREYEKGYEILLAITGPDLRADLVGGEEGLSLSISPLRSNTRALQGTVLMHGVGKDPYELIHRLYDRAFDQLRREKELLGRHTLPPVFEGLGWCTWDSLSQNVDEKAILEKMEEFKSKGITLAWVLIDDGWSLVNREALTLRGLEADPERFPRGLAATIRTLKETYQVKYVGVWQAMKGYWYGIEEGSKAHQDLSPYLMRYGSGEITMKPTPEASFGFWNTWHQRLKAMGVDFVKIDGQGSVATMLRGDAPERDAMASLYAGMEASVLLNFGGNLINCMGLAPENVWNRHAISLSRSSDDYTPTVPGSIVEHALQNTYNNVYQGSLYIGDWDMVWSDHEESEYGTLLRVLSGGPVYISDGLGKTRKEVVERIARPDGSLFLCTDIARPTLDCLTRNAWEEGKALKIYNTLPGAAYVGCFSWDIAKDALEDSFSLTDLPGVKKALARAKKEGEEPSYLAYDWTTHQVIRTRDRVSFTLCAREARLFQIVPEEEAVTVLGLTNKYLSRAGVCVRSFESLTLVDVSAPGTLGFVTDRKVRRICRADRPEEELSSWQENDLWQVRLEEAGEVLIETIL